MHANDRRLAKFRGLALSGGGFRASFFHIGVLARLAELDLLRSVEAISTVSGGSIVGSLYFLKVKRCVEAALREKRAVEVGDHIQIVSEMCDEFLGGARKDLRSRTFGHWPSNYRGSNSERIAELYDDVFYAPYRTESGARIRMIDLRSGGASEAGGEHPLPALYINATVLNTGQKWVFTPDHMHAIDRPGGSSKADGSDPLPVEEILSRQHRYEKVEGLSDLSLGLAVAASACVPMVFPPVELRLLPFAPEELGRMVGEIALEVGSKEQERLVIQLVDGGVVDNLGLEPLLKLESVLVSNASAPPRFVEMRSRRPSAIGSARTSFAVINQKTQQAATRQALARLGDDMVQVTLAGANQAGAWGKNSKELVSTIAGIRTDLDAFTDWEAHALMEAGYVSARHALRDRQVVQEAEWPFTWVRQALNREQGRRHLGGSASHFKLVRLLPPALRENPVGFMLLAMIPPIYLLMLRVDPAASPFEPAANLWWTLLGFLLTVGLLAKRLIRAVASSGLTLVSWGSLLLRPLLLRGGAAPPGRSGVAGEARGPRRRGDRGS